jgi:protein-S-isoprenylcysteine O-methyltransferase Ste14
MPGGMEDFKLSHFEQVLFLRILSLYSVQSMISGFGLWLLLIGYLLVAAFLVIERQLRRSAIAKTLRRGNFDRGSTLLIGATFGVGLLLPVVMDTLDVGLFSIGLVEGLLALAIMMIGLGLRVWAANTLGRYYTRTLLTTEGQKVITTGPYAVIRHPGYLGEIFMWSGFGVLSSNLLVAVIFPVLFAATYLYRINVEEKMLGEALGDDYLQYRKRTCRLIPFVY